MQQTKINDEGRGTYLNWVRVQHAGCYVVGHITDNAGRYGTPKVYALHVNAHGGQYVMVDGRRVYLTRNCAGS